MPWTLLASGTRKAVLLGSTNATVGGVEKQDENVIIGNGQQGVSILPVASRVRPGYAQARRPISRTRRDAELLADSTYEPS